MFNLDETLLEWRRQMLAAGIKTPVPLDELESHLRDEIEQQTKSGVSEAEAFQAAVQKIGLAHDLQTEFKKIETTFWTRSLIAGPSEQKLWQLFAVVFPCWLAWKMGRDVLHKPGLTPGQTASCLAAIAAMLLLVWGGRLGYKLFPVIRTRRVRNTIGCGCALLPVFWWAAFFRLIAPGYGLDMGQASVLTFFVWSVAISAGVPIGLLWGIETAAQKKPVIG